MRTGGSGLSTLLAAGAAVESVALADVSRDRLELGKSRSESLNTQAEVTETVVDTTSADPVAQRTKGRDAQLELDSGFTAAGVTAVPCGGIASGWTDLMARRVDDGMDSVSGIIVRWVEYNDGGELMSTVDLNQVAGLNLPTQHLWADGQSTAADMFETEEPYEWPGLGEIQTKGVSIVGALAEWKTILCKVEARGQRRWDRVEAAETTGEADV